jgi:hypothetical protein
VPQSRFTTRPWVQPGRVPLSVQTKFVVTMGLQLPAAPAALSSSSSSSPTTPIPPSTTPQLDPPSAATITLVRRSEFRNDDIVLPHREKQGTAFSRDLPTSVSGIVIDTIPTTTLLSYTSSSPIVVASSSSKVLSFPPSSSSSSSSSTFPLSPQP